MNNLKVSPEEEREINERKSVGAVVVHEAVRREGEEELGRPSSALAWSGLASGLSMGLSFLAEALLQAHLPDTQWRPLVTKLGYCLGFLVVILGRQQLFTENTLTVILPLMHNRDSKTLVNVIRLWSVVLTANLFGVWLFTFGLRAPAFEPAVLDSLTRIGHEAMSAAPSGILVKGIFAGWLIALMVWLLPGAKGSRAAMIIIITYMIGMGELSHIIAGSTTVLYLATTGQVGYLQCITGFMVPALAGNIIGGVSLVAALNHAQVVSGADKNQK